MQCRKMIVKLLMSHAEDWSNVGVVVTRGTDVCKEPDSIACLVFFAPRGTRAVDKLDNYDKQ